MILSCGLEVDDEYWNGLINYLKSYGLNVVEAIENEGDKTQGQVD
jgi:hypothetical protein